MSAHSHPFKDEPVAQAARHIDAMAEEHGIEWIVEHIGLDMLKLVHLAEQRALRAVLIQSGREDEANPQRLTMVALNAEERERVLSMIPCYMDGISIGWEGRRLADED